MATENIKTEKKVKRTYPLLDGENVSQEIFVAVNFKPYRIMRGVEVDLPESVAKALDEADRARNEEIMNRRKKALREPSNTTLGK